MKKERFFELMNGTDDELIDRAENYSPYYVNIRAHRIIRWTAVAACLCIIIAACIAVPISMRRNSKDLPDIIETTESDGTQNGTVSDDTMSDDPNAKPDDEENYIELPATEGLVYRFLINENAYSISGYEGEATEVVIPSTYNGLPVISIDYSSSMDGCVLTTWGAFSDNENITSVVIQKNLKTIQDQAFSGCTNLKSVTLGRDVETIGWDAFMNCTSLESIVIPDSVKHIEYSAFYGCKNLSDISISDEVESIDRTAFVDTAYYNDAKNWDKGVIYIGNHLLRSQGVRGTYTVREGTKTISTHAFSNNDDLMGIVLPESLLYINENAFSQCTWLRDVEIPSGVIRIESCAFSGCSRLKSVSISNTVKSIGGSAFSSCAELESIEIPESVESIGRMAFWKCTSLENIVLPDTLQEIGCDAFEETAYYNEESNWEDGVLYIGKYLVQSGENVARHLTVKEGTRLIADWTLIDNDRILSIKLPKSLEIIGNAAFTRCYKLAEIYNLSSINIVKGEKHDNGSIGEYVKNIYTSWNVPSKFVQDNGYILYCDEANNEYGIVEYSGDEAELSLPQTLDGHSYEIYSEAFLNCTGITSVNISDGVIAIGDSAFSGCTNLSSITISDNVRYIGVGAFSETAYENNQSNWTDNNTTLYIGNHLICVRGYDTYSSNRDTEYVIREGTKTIAGGAFSSQEKLTSVIIPDGVVSIGDSAFFGNSLYEIKIPESVEYIGERAFRFSENLKHVTIPSKVKVIQEYTFSESYKLESIVVGSGVMEIEPQVFYYNTKAMSVYYDGTQNEWNAMKVSYEGYNKSLLRSTVYFYSETKPTTEGNYWHYVDGAPAVWTVE